MNGKLEDVIALLNRLREKNIYYCLNQIREEAIMVLISVPGERWEVELFEDGSIEIEIYKSNGNIYDEKKLEEMFSTFSD